MRKFFALLLLMFGLTLTSCGGPKQDLKSLRTVGDSIDAEIQEELKIKNFDMDNNSFKIYKESRDSKSYYDIYLANDYTDRLFIHSVDLKAKNNGSPIINDRTKELYANTLMFNVPTYQDEVTAILSEVYNSKYGLPSLDLGFTQATNHEFQKKAYTMDEKYLASAVLDENLPVINLEIVYLPVYVVRTYEEKRIYKNYFFIPVHYAICTEDKQFKSNKDNENHYELIDKEVSNIAVSNIKLDPKDSTKVLSTLTPAE